MRAQDLTSYTAAIYCRLSQDDEQVGESVSIETQKMMLTDYCAEHGYEIFDIYVDDGFSGLNFNRPAFSQLLRDIDKGLVNLVVTKDLSRLGRDYIQTGYLTDIYFVKKRIRYIAVNDGIDTNRNDNDIAPFKNILNDMYAKDLSRKIKLAKKQRALKGYFISSQSPYGYKPDPNNRNHLVIDEEAASVVRMIFKLATEGYSCLGISRKLAELKILTPGAYRVKWGDTKFIRHLSREESRYEWSYVTVRTILSDSVYKGDMVNHKTEVINYKTKESISIPRDQYIIVPNQHEPIISCEEFEQVQQILRSRTHAARHNFENVFKGRVFCLECGEPLTLISHRTRKGQQKPLLKCFNHYSNPQQCTHYHAVLYEDLYAEVLSKIQILFNNIKNSGIFENLVSQISKQEESKQADEEKAKISKELSAIRRNLSDLRKSVDKNARNQPDNLALLSGLLKRQEQLTQRFTKIEYGEVEYDIDREKIKESLDAFFNIENLTENIVSNLIKKIEVGETFSSEGRLNRKIFITYAFENIL